jgi:hypothetical protein
MSRRYGRLWDLFGLLAKRLIRLLDYNVNRCPASFCEGIPARIDRQCFDARTSPLEAMRRATRCMNSCLPRYAMDGVDSLHSIPQRGLSKEQRAQSLPPKE